MSWKAIVEQVADQVPPTQEGAGRAPLPGRMMVGLLYLKDACDLSDDQVHVRWVESPYMWYFLNVERFKHELPCGPCSLTRSRPAKLAE